jgi:hypothetical protein
MKTKKIKQWAIALCILPMLAVYAFTFKATAQEWELIESRDGVEFYMMNTISNISTIQNTVVKIRNTNDFELEIRFQPAIACDVGEGAKQGAVTVFVAANDESSLYTYKVCRNLQKPIVTIAALSITRR